MSVANEETVAVATSPGGTTTPNEDWVGVHEGLVVVLDGATARVDTGCSHGVAWFAQHLGGALMREATSVGSELPEVLAAAIREVAALHPGCDLSHPGTPSAAVAVLRSVESHLQYLVLGDTTVVMNTSDGLRLISDQRVSDTARAEREAADRYPIGSPQKSRAFLAMKRAELAARNRLGGYWIAANDPRAARHALTGEIPQGDVRRVAVLTDGAARLVDLFGMVSWHQVLDQLDTRGPDALIRQVRDVEATDPLAQRWPRNKASDDATIAYWRREVV